MKYIIASDIHGSAYYCQNLLEAYRKEKADCLLLLGDILYHGPRNPLPKGYNPKEVFAMLNEVKDEIICVRGNCDSEVDQMVLEFPMMADYCILDVDGRIWFATHGHLFHNEKLPPLKAGSVLLNGHFHLPVCQETEGITYINPGSIALPKEQAEHSYISYEKGVFTWKDIMGKEFRPFASY